MKTVKAACVLHNYLLDTPLNSSEETLPLGIPIQGNNVNRSGNKEARDEREKLSDYFMSTGKIDFQWKMAFQTSNE